MTEKREPFGSAQGKQAPALHMHGESFQAGCFKIVWDRYFGA